MLKALGGIGLVGLAAAYAVRDRPEYCRLVDEVAVPLLRRLDPETAHDAAVFAARWKLTPKAPAPPPALAITALGLDFASPVGLAAGFDKHGRAVSGLLDLGFGFVEVGSVTPLPQPGNERPRLFRLPEDGAVINCYGFNSVGLEAARESLAAGAPFAGGVLGVNVGKNKQSADAGADYAAGIAALGPLADYVVVNVSSPNTPGLRQLQRRDELQALLRGCAAAVASLDVDKRPPLLVKIAPDLHDAQLDDIAAVVLETPGVDGVVVSNTTVQRPASLQGEHRGEAGGLSGAPLRELATATLRGLYRRTQGRVPLIGVGGVASGADAYEKIRAGASLVQLYSALVFEGPGLVRRVNAELAELLRRDGYGSVGEAVGVDV